MDFENRAKNLVATALPIADKAVDEAIFYLSLPVVLLASAGLVAITVVACLAIDAHRSVMMWATSGNKKNLPPT